MELRALETRLRAAHLTALGGFHCTPEDVVPEGTQTLILVAPHEPAFWPAFAASPEYLDGAADPMDRWSSRVLSDLAEAVEATALFPFGPKPFHPFFSWALRTGCVWPSPIQLLVSDRAGLFVSFRGALALKVRIDLPAPQETPCTTCAAPCTTACPVEAFAGGGYDVARCKSYLATEAGQDCMLKGCAARRACPVSAAYPRLRAQSHFHMKAFHPQ